jgi:glycosyltransferase involved in cell wall biosynthesis
MRASPETQPGLHRWLYSRCHVLPPFDRRSLLTYFQTYAHNLRQLAKLKTDFDRFGPDLVFVRNDLSFLAFALRYAGVRNLPVVYQLSHFKEEEMMVIARKGRLPDIGLWLKGALGRVGRGRLIRRCDLILPISDSMRDRLMASGVPRARMMSVPLGVDPSMTEDELPAFTLPARFVLYIGTFAPLRRIDFTINAFARIASVFPDLRLLLLGGHGRRSEEEALRQHAVATGLADRIVVHPQIPRRQVPAVIRRASLALSLIPPDSIGMTLSPTKVMEYLQFGCPVLGTLGIPEQEIILRESGAGDLVPFDVEAAALGMARMLASDDLSERGAKGRAYILANRNYEKLAARLLATFRSLVAVRATASNPTTR